MGRQGQQERSLLGARLEHCPSMKRASYSPSVLSVFAVLATGWCGLWLICFKFELVKSWSHHNLIIFKVKA